MKKPNKQPEVTAASFKRMAKTHRDKGREHRIASKRYSKTDPAWYMHTGIAIGHAEAAAILDSEAKLIRAKR